MSVSKTFAKVLGPIVAALALFGLFTQDHLLGVANVNIALDLLRIPVAAALVYVGYSKVDEKTAAGVVNATGILYIGIAIMGLFSRTLFEIVPSGLTEFDIAFHAIAGLAALAASTRIQLNVNHHYRHAPR